MIAREGLITSYATVPGLLEATVRGTKAEIFGLFIEDEVLYAGIMCLFDHA